MDAQENCAELRRELRRIAPELRTWAAPPSSARMNPNWRSSFIDTTTPRSRGSPPPRSSTFTWRAHLPPPRWSAASTNSTRSPASSFTTQITARPEHIDVLGHVNNAVWVQWMEQVSVDHWMHDADPAHVEAYIWVVTRHEIDYRGNVVAGETVTAETWVPDPPKGARFDRHVRFLDAQGQVKVEAVTTWALIDRATGRLLRVTPEIAAPFRV